MFEMFVNAEGGLTTAGYAVTVVAGIVLFLAAWYLGRHGIWRAGGPLKRK